MKKSRKCGTCEVVILGNTFQKSAVNRKIGKSEALVIVVGGNLTEFRLIGAQAQKWEIPKMGLIESDDYGKYFSKKFRKIVTSGKQKPLVIVAVENLTEIRPIGGKAQKWEIPQNGAPRK